MQSFVLFQCVVGRQQPAVINVFNNRSKVMRQVFLGLFMLMSQAALAGAECAEYAESERMSVLDLQKKIVNEYGFAIKKFKVDDNCYEIYGWEALASGEEQRVEVYFDMANGAIVKKEVD
ncbi:PepSY domain-containing protein [Luminiphilus sp.]|nr:PepSY domain-containing protein [Luminiphilus sp.]